MAVAAHVGVSTPTTIVAGLRGVPRREAPARTARHGGGRHASTTTSRTTRRRSPRRWRACGAAHPAARIWAIFEPRSATSCRRVFQQAFTEAFDAADEIVARGGLPLDACPTDERLDAEAVVADVNARGRHARHVPSVAADRRAGRPRSARRRPRRRHVERRVRRDPREAAGGARRALAGPLVGSDRKRDWFPSDPDHAQRDADRRLHSWHEIAPWVTGNQTVRSDPTGRNYCPGGLRGAVLGGITGVTAPGAPGCAVGPGGPCGGRGGAGSGVPSGSSPPGAG